MRSANVLTALIAQLHRDDGPAVPQRPAARRLFRHRDAGRGLAGAAGQAHPGGGARAAGPDGGDDRRVPLANFLGQTIGWRWSFAIVGALALLTAALVAIYAPRDLPDRTRSPLAELDALKRGQVWLTLGIGAIGFGGLFAVYTYLASTLTEVTGVSPLMVPVVLMVFGVGMTAGNLIIPRFADRALMPTAAALLVWSLGGAGALSARRAEFLDDADRCLRDRRRRRAGHGVADAADGRVGRCAGAGGGAEPFGVQCGQRAGAMARRAGDRGRVWLDVDRLGRLRPRAGRAGDPGGVGESGAAVLDPSSRRGDLTRGSTVSGFACLQAPASSHAFPH